MKRLLYIFGIAVVLSSCSEYQKVLKSEDIKEKYDFAEKLYKEGKYKKANRLFELILPKYRGKPQGERLTYFYAKSLYETEDYYLSSYQFERFTRSYPKSDSLEIASFYEAKSFYELSPVYSIDQTETVKAIDKLQEFINKFPSSSKIAEANTLVKELTTKIEKKAFEIAKQYNTISDYKSAIKASENFISDFPGTSFREDAMFLKLDSMYKLAVNSYEYLMEERLKDALSAHKTLMKFYPETKYKDEVADMHETIEKELQRFTK